MRHACIYLLSLAIGLASCSDSNMKFDRGKWVVHEDLGQPSPYRKKMLKDLTTNYKLVGMKYFQLIELLGKPNFQDSSSVSYDIVVDYGHDIDPVYVKLLSFSFSADSIIQSFKVNEYDNR